MVDSHDLDWYYDPDSCYNERLRREMKKYWEGEGDYMHSLEENSYD